MLSCVTQKTASAPEPTTPPPSAQPVDPAQAQKKEAIEKASQLYAKNDPQAALGVMEDIAREFPDDLDVLLLRCSALVSAGKLPLAAAEIDRIIAAHKDSIPALLMGAKIAELSQESARRQALLERAYALDPTNAETLASLADMNYANKNWADAKKYYQAILSLPAEQDAGQQAAQEPAMIGLANSLYMEKNYQEAKDAFTKTIATHPESSPAYFGRSKAEYRLGNYKESLADLDVAIEKDPASGRLREYRGRQLYGMGESGKALEDFNVAIQLEPGSFISYVFRGGILDEQARYTDALNDYRKVISIYPDYWYVFETAATTAFRLGYWQEAATDFQKAFDKAPESCEYSVLGALALMRNGSFKDASTYAKNAIAKVNKEKNHLYWSVLKLIQVQDDQLGEIELVSQAETNLDIKAAAYFYCAEYFLAKGRPEIASDYFDRSKKLGRVETLEYRLMETELGSKTIAR